MILFPLITITDSTPFTFEVNFEKWPLHNVLTHLIAWCDDAGGNIYCGNKPLPATTYPGLSTGTGANRLRPGPLPEMTPDAFVAVMPGTVFSCSSHPENDGNFVIANHGAFLEFRNNFTVDSDGEDIILTPPDVSSTNGMPLLPGTERQWTTSCDARFLSKPIKFVVATGETSYLRLAYEIA